MASTTALFTGLSGLDVHARKLDVIGNNIANVNTTAFKSNRMMFAPLFSRTLSLGTRPDGDSGGTNPGQIGLGVKVAGTQRDMSTGAISATGISTDLAIEGAGFFVVANSDGQAYTRSGNFSLNATNELVTMDGAKVQGYGIDQDFNIVTGNVGDISIPLGTLTIARATDNVYVGGNLNADGEVATRAGVLTTGPLDDILGAPITASTLLVELQDIFEPAGIGMFDAGDTLRISGATKDNQQLPDADLAIDAATSVQDYLDFFDDVFGIIAGQSVIDENGNAATSGAQLDAATGEIRILGNTGVVNDFTLVSGDVLRLDSAGSFVRNPFDMNKDQSPTGESVRTQFVVYDSLGTELLVNLSFVLESRSNAGNTWRYYAESSDDTDLNRALALPSPPTISFDTFGNLRGDTTFNIGIDRDSTGATTPLTFSVDLDSQTDRLQQLSDPSGQSEVAATYQDGVPIGTLNSFGVGADGVISGAFSNGLTRTIGQLPLATFRNPQGLVDEGTGLFRVGPNSGNAVIAEPQTFGAGSLLGGALELSNVDLSREFTDLILTTTGYTASSRIISTTNELMQQLLLLGR